MFFYDVSWYLSDWIAGYYWWRVRNRLLYEARQRYLDRHGCACRQQDKEKYSAESSPKK